MQQRRPANTAMKSNLVDTLYRWVTEHRESLSQRGIQTAYTPSPRVGAGSAYLDLESNTSIGRATVWNAGFCDMEILAIESAEQTFCQHHHEVADDDVAALLELLVERMR